MTKIATLSARLRQRFASAEIFMEQWRRQLIRWVPLLFVLFPFLAAPVAAEGTLELAPGLSVSVPSSLGVTQDPDTPGLLIGEIEGAPGYFMSASRVERNERDNVLWARLEAELRKSGRKVDQLFKGHFTTHEGVPVTYRGYRYRVKNQGYRQVYYLIKGEGRDGRNRSYWVYLTAVETVHLHVILPFAEVLLKRAELHETLN